MRLGHGSSGVTMSFVDMFACALGALLFIMFSMSDHGAENDPILIHPLRIVTDSLPAVHAGQPIALALSAQGGIGHYRWMLGDHPQDRTVCGRERSTYGLPPGLTLHADGQLVGTPQMEPGTADVPLEMPRRYCFDVEVVNAGVTEVVTPFPGDGPGKEAGGPPPEDGRKGHRRTLVIELWPPLVVQASAVRATTLPTAFLGHEYEYHFNDGEAIAGRSWAIKARFQPKGSAASTGLTSARIHPERGVLSWQPSYEGTLHLSVFITDALGTSVARFEVPADRRPVPYLAPTILTTKLPDAVVDLPYEVALAALNGEPPLRWDIQGTLPKGFELKNGIIRGTASTDQLKQGSRTPYEFRLSVTDWRGVPETSHPMTLAVVPAGRPDWNRIKIVTKPEDVAANPFVIGKSEHVIAFAATGGAGAQTWNITFAGDPLGLRSDGNRMLAGVDPLALRPGTATARVSVHSQDGSHDEKDFTIHVVPPKVHLVSSLAGDIATNSGLRLAIAARGGSPPYAYDVPSLPETPWLRPDFRNGILTLTGAPPTPASFDVRVSARDSLGNASTVTAIPVLIPAPLTIKSPDRYVQQAGTAFREKLFASGVTGTPRWGLSKYSGGAWLRIGGDGVLEGTPQDLEEASVAVSVMDDTGQVATKTITIQVIPGTQGRQSQRLVKALKKWDEIEAYFKGYALCTGPTRTCELPPGVVGQPYVLGQMPGKAAARGRLPDGLNNPQDITNGSFWTIGGVPKEAGTFHFSIRLSDEDGNPMVEDVKLQLTVLSRFAALAQAFRNWLAQPW